MSVSFRRFVSVFAQRSLLALTILSLSSAVLAANNDNADTTQTRVWQAEQVDQPEPDRKGHRHPVMSMVKGIGKELKYDATEAFRDSIFVFSAQDIDPYESKSPPKDRPYTVATFRLIDGATGRFVKFPDGSGRVYGGFADGTCLIPAGQNQWLVKYPNGVQGKLNKMGNGTMRLQRPDNTVTTFGRNNNGGYRIENSSIGYMGEVNPDDAGFKYELQ